jgi:hypothetical protein
MKLLVPHTVTFAILQTNSSFHTQLLSRFYRMKLLVPHTVTFAILQNETPRSTQRYYRNITRWNSCFHLPNITYTNANRALSYSSPLRVISQQTLKWTSVNSKQLAVTTLTVTVPYRTQQYIPNTSYLHTHSSKPPRYTELHPTSFYENKPATDSEWTPCNNECNL